MPYRRSYRKKRVFRRRKGNGGMRRIARSEARKQINRSIESKVFDGAIASTGIDYSGSIYNLLSDPSGGTTITQGVTENQYIGTKINPTYLHIKYQWQGSDTFNMVRLMVVQVKGLFVPTAADILQSVGNVRAPLSSLDLDADDRYRVLYDRISQLEVGNGAGRGAIVGKVRISGRKLRRVVFSDGAGVYEANGIYLLVITDSGVASHPLLQAYWRNHFKDA